MLKYKYRNCCLALNPTIVGRKCDIMYRVVNKTSKEIFIYGNKIVPNQEMIITNSIFDAKSFKNEELGELDITSQYGQHSCRCSGNIMCEPENGEDGTIFTISEKS